MVVDIPDVVKYANFGDHRLRGFWVAVGQISPSLIDFHRRPYNTLALPCERVIVFDPVLTGHVIRRIRSGRVRIFSGNQRATLSLIAQERIGVGASNLVVIINVGVDACGILSRSVGQINRK